MTSPYEEAMNRHANMAVIFDLDGVLTDTAELHYQSWQALADRLGLPFNRAANEALRGLGRRESLDIVLADAAAALSETQKTALADEKNAIYLDYVSRMTPADLLPGAAALLYDLRQYGFRVAVASSSRNAAAVIERLGIAPQLDIVVDGNEATRSKPDPQVFLLAAERLGVIPQGCVVVEDAESGVRAARAAGMVVIGIGPEARVGRADRVVATIGELRISDVVSLLDAAGART